MSQITQVKSKLRQQRVKSILATVFIATAGGGSGDVVGPASAVADNLASFNGGTGKIIKDSGLSKDGSGGLVGLTLFKINFKNALNTFTSFFTNSNTAARTYSFLDRDGTISDLFVDRPKGTTNNRYHINAGLAFNSANATITINVLRAIPVVINHVTTIDTILFEVQSGASGNIRMGIYADDGTGYPGALVVETGQVTATTGVKSVAVNVTLQPGLYWFAYLGDTANVFRATTALLGNLGFSSGIGPNGQGVAYTVAQAYGAMPTTFTTGATVLTIGTITNFPLILYREI